VFLEDVVDGALEHARVVDSNVVYLSEPLDIRDAVPARPATARNGAVHDVIGNEEECLKLSRNDYG
jgi:hypothetical protein